MFRAVVVISLTLTGLSPLGSSARAGPAAAAAKPGGGPSGANPVPAGAAVPSRYTRAMFARAMGNDSTAPDYVLITVVDVRNGDSGVVCVESRSLEGALHRELGIPYDEAGSTRVTGEALQHTDQVFRFSKRAALRDVRPFYTAEQLDAARVRIAGRSDRKLLDYDFVQSLYHWNDGSREAAAHALLERGLGCVRGCRAGDLTTYRPDRR